MPDGADRIRSQILQYLGYRNEKRKPVQISFFGGNFLGLTTDRIKHLLNLATDFVHQGMVDSIRFSTRPDTISSDRLDIIKQYPIETVELGVQSMDERVLTLSKRGHGAADTIRAVHLLKAREYNIGLQMMVGLPGDTEALSVSTAEKMAALRPDFVRIYPAIVVKGSQLANWYRSGTYVPLSLAEAVTRVKKLFRLFKNHGIRVIRMGLQASEDLEDGTTILAGPYHPAFGHLVYSKMFLDAAQEALDSIKTLPDTITISVNPRSISKMRGLKNENIKKLGERYPLKSIKVIPVASLPAEELIVR